jgi:hypothetical protein
VRATPLRYASLRLSARLWLQPRIDLMLERTSPALTHHILEGSYPHCAISKITSISTTARDYDVIYHVYKHLSDQPDL